MSLSDEDMDRLQADNRRIEKEHIAAISKIPSPSPSNLREWLWVNVLVFKQRESFGDPYYAADRALIEFDKRFPPTSTETHATFGQDQSPP